MNLSEWWSRASHESAQLSLAKKILFTILHNILAGNSSVPKNSHLELDFSSFRLGEIRRWAERWAKTMMTSVIFRVITQSFTAELQNHILSAKQISHLSEKFFSLILTSTPLCDVNDLMRIFVEFVMNFQEGSEKEPWNKPERESCEASYQHSESRERNSDLHLENSQSSKSWSLPSSSVTAEKWDCVKNRRKSSRSTRLHIEVFTVHFRRPQSTQN